MQTITKDNRSKPKSASHYKTKIQNEARSSRVFRKAKMNIIFSVQSVPKTFHFTIKAFLVLRDIQYQGHQQAVKHAVG